jgi:ubiquinone/menaquinone biosynthesis C-methylase UbiE
VPGLSDPTYVSDQYRDASKLEARIRLHALFSTNKHGWHRWVFDQLDLPSASRILELGCGDGTLWRLNLERVPSGWDITLSDRSFGMLCAARHDLSSSHARFCFAAVDAQEIPFAKRAFDAVIANHMLYHVPDRTRALSEIHRVLKPGGHLYASTVGQDHLRELDELIRRVEGTNRQRMHPATESFLLENGGAQLTPWFSGITTSRYQDALVVTDVELLTNYILSTAPRSTLTSASLAALTHSLERTLSQQGAIRITKDSGMFHAVRPDPPSPGHQHHRAGEHEAAH